MRQKREPRRASAHNLERELFRGNWGNFAMTMVAAVGNAAVNLLISWLMQRIMDAIVGGGESLRSIFLATLEVTGLLCGTLAINYWFKPRFFRRAMGQYKTAVYDALMKKGISAFSGENTARYISALSNDAASIETNFLEKFFPMVTCLLMFVGALGMMLWYSPVLTLAAVALSLLPLLVSLGAGNRAATAEKRVSAASASFMDTLKDSLMGFPVIKSFRAERPMCGIFRRSVAEVEEEKCRRRRLSTFLSGLGSVAGFCTQMGVFLVGALLARKDMGITAGVVVVFVQLMNFVLIPIQTVPEAYAGWRAARAVMGNLSDSLTEHVRDTGIAIPARLETGITLENVGFSYGEQPVLQGVTAKLEAGKAYCIVGASGSGKSTLLNLLMAGNPDYTGSIRYDAQEVREVNPESLYGLASVVQQNVFVFNSSLLDNVTMFQDFPQEEVERAARLSGLGKLVAERGWDYPCGENGSALSGGEKQRLSIARSLLRRTQVLLVDEATAALDPQTAYQVSDAILELEGLTRIVVTHSLEAALLQRYDGILTLKNGKIVESGTFAELMARKGYFYSLFTVAQA